MRDRTRVGGEVVREGARVGGEVVRDGVRVGGDSSDYTWLVQYMK